MAHGLALWTMWEGPQGLGQGLWGSPHPTVSFILTSCRSAPPPASGHFFLSRSLSYLIAPEIFSATLVEFGDPQGKTAMWVSPDWPV